MLKTEHSLKLFEIRTFVDDLSKPSSYYLQHILFLMSEPFFRTITVLSSESESNSGTEQEEEEDEKVSEESNRK